MSKNIVRIDESGLRKIVAEGVKKVLNRMLKESMADYEWERQMDMQDRYEEEQFIKELGWKAEIDYWARKGWLSPKQQVFNLFGFLDNVHRKPTVPLLDDEQLNAAIEKAAKLKATYEQQQVRPEKVKAVNYIYNCLMNQKNFPDQYEQAKADQFFQREKDAIDMQHYQAEREYDKRNPGIRDIGPEARMDIMNNNPGRYVNQRKVKPGRDYRYDSEMKNGEKEMNDTFGKQSWFPGNFDEQ